MTRAGREFKELRAVVKVLGLGGAGGNAVNRMADEGIYGVELIAANTDAQDLRRSRAHVCVQLGEGLTRGLGVGGDPAKGRLAALESKESLREVLHGADMVFIAAGMGGGTGTGAAAVAAQIAKSLGALSVGVVTRPFGFELQVKAGKAEAGIQELRGCVDALLVIPNDRVFEVIDAHTSTEEAFRRVDDVLYKAIRSTSEVITRSSEMNIDLNDIRSVMTDAGEALIGVGEAEGPNRALEAARKAITSPLLENVSIEGAKGLLVHIAGGSDLAMDSDVNEVMKYIGQLVNKDASAKFGMLREESLGSRVRITVIATGFPPQRARAGAFKPLREAAGAAPRPFAYASGGPSAQDLDKPAFLRLKPRKLK